MARPLSLSGDWILLQTLLDLVPNRPSVGHFIGNSPGLSRAKKTTPLVRYFPGEVPETTSNFRNHRGHWVTTPMPYGTFRYVVMTSNPLNAKHPSSGYALIAPRVRKRNWSMLDWPESSPRSQLLGIRDSFP
jgi:hypothetical protein